LRTKRRRVLLVAVGVLVSAAALAYLVYGLRGAWGGLVGAFREAHYGYVIASTAFLGVMYALRVLRWKVLLRPVGDVSYATIASATCIGFMSSCVLPLRPGELIRPYVVHKRGGIGFGDAAGTALGLERVFDLLGVCCLVLLTWVLLRGQADGTDFVATLAHRGVWFAALTAAGLVGLGALAFFPRFVLHVAGFLLRPLPRGARGRLMGFAESVTCSMAFLKSPRQVLVAAVLSVAIWMMSPISTYALAYGFGVRLTFAAALVIQVCVTAAVALPQAPGFIGPFQVATMKATELFGVAEGDAGAFAMMLWAVNVVPITIVGLGFLRHEGLNLLQLAQASERAADGGEGEAG